MGEPEVDGKRADGDPHEGDPQPFTNSLAKTPMPWAKDERNPGRSSPSIAVVVLENLLAVQAEAGSRVFDLIGFMDAELEAREFSKIERQAQSHDERIMARATARMLDPP